MTNMTALARFQQPQTTKKIFVRKPGALEMTGLKHATWHNQLKEGLWAPAVPLGSRARGYLVSEIEAVCRARISGKSPDAIRALVLFLSALAYEELIDKPASKTSFVHYDGVFPNCYAGACIYPKQHTTTEAEIESDRLIADNSYEAYLKMTPEQRMARLNCIAEHRCKPATVTEANNKPATARISAADCAKRSDCVILGEYKQ
jgi:predicted DNA-binding transcriptional regulator AlpA